MLPRFCLSSILSRELIGWNSSSWSKWMGARCKDDAKVNISTTPVLLSSLAIAVLLLSSNNGGRKKYLEQSGQAPTAWWVSGFQVLQQQQQQGQNVRQSLEHPTAIYESGKIRKIFLLIPLQISLCIRTMHLCLSIIGVIAPRLALTGHCL